MLLITCSKTLFLHYEPFSSDLPLFPVQKGSLVQVSCYIKKSFEIVQFHQILLFTYSEALIPPSSNWALNEVAASSAS